MSAYHDPDLPVDPRVLWCIEIRYLMADLMMRSPERIWKVSDFVDEFGALGVKLGDRPSKRLSDLLRTEVGIGRAVRVGWGRYRFGRAPDTTRRRIQRRTRAVRDWLDTVNRREAGSIDRS